MACGWLLHRCAGALWCCIAITMELFYVKIIIYWQVIRLRLLATSIRDIGHNATTPSLFPQSAKVLQTASTQKMRFSLISHVLDLDRLATDSYRILELISSTRGHHCIIDLSYCFNLYESTAFLQSMFVLCIRFSSPTLSLSCIHRFSAWFRADGF